ncbi:MAG: DUF3015 family protein [Nitrospirota bacterium]|nr:DUF3015 family protein [Nitrospirota bacterium]MDP2381986.1 DUF3015 family protein [Nitrospirota bacterium]MDP3598595.1 DUF3015 family protein [Nitrospirota bacterium]
MRTMTLKGLVGALVLAGVGLVTTACNTSKATVDTFAKFTSSTSPGEMFDADGYVKQSQKARLFTAVAFENLEQDIARGNGEYLASLGVLLNISAADQEEFRTRAQSAYPRLFASDGRTAESLLAMLTRQREDGRTDRP